MPGPQDTHRLRDLTIELRDGHGASAPYIVSHTDGDLFVGSYVFQGRRQSPLRAAVGDQVRFSASDEAGQILGTGELVNISQRGAVSVRVTELSRRQRRSAFRVGLRVPAVLRSIDNVRRGTTVNISITGFAARFEGTPGPDGASFLVALELPDEVEDNLVIECRKVGGDIVERFAFVDVSAAVDRRLSALVRSVELRHRKPQR